MGTLTFAAARVFNEMVEELSGCITQQTVDNLLMDLKESEGKSNYLEIVSKLERIMDSYHIPHKRVLDNAGYYKQLLSQYTFPTYEEMVSRMLYIILSKMDEYYTPEQYMKRIIDHLEDEALGWQKDTVRLRILKQFIKEGNTLKDVGIKGDGTIRKYVKRKNPNFQKIPNKELTVKMILDTLEDDVFEPVDPENKNTTANQRKPDGTYGILAICDDLGKGLFHKNGFTKRYLIYLAMVYSMRYYPEENTEYYDADKDIEATLFEGYYVNNITRFLRDEYKQDTYGRYEKDPSGQGINPKDYRDLVWLYYLNSSLPPAEKLKKSAEMIRRLQSSTSAKEVKKYNTQWYSQRWSHYFLRTEDELFELIQKDFNCGDLNTESEEDEVLSQKNAFRVYRKLLQELRREGLSLFDCNYGISLLVDGTALQKSPQEFLEEYPDISQKKLQDFLILTTRFNELISGSSLRVDKAEDMSRLKILGLCYYLFTEENGDMQQNEDFRTVCTAFEEQADQYLSEAHYPLFSYKNYFDVLIAFAAFAGVN